MYVYFCVPHFTLLFLLLSLTTGLCANVQCKFGARCEGGVCICPTECPLSREPVCGSNLITYTNECELQKAACTVGHPLNVHFYGDCKEGLSAAIGNDTKNMLSAILWWLNIILFVMTRDHGDRNFWSFVVLMKALQFVIIILLNPPSFLIFSELFFIL